MSLLEELQDGLIAWITLIKWKLYRRLDQEFMTLEDLIEVLELAIKGE